MKKVVITFSEEIGGIKVETEDVTNPLELLNLLQLATDAVLNQIRQNSQVIITPPKTPSPGGGKPDLKIIK